MKHSVRVVGHRLVKRGELEMLEVKLTNAEGARVTLVDAPENRDQYPLGCEAALGFSIQQSLPLQPGEGGRNPETRRRKAKNGAGESEGVSAASH